MKRIGRFDVTVGGDERYVWEPDETTVGEAIAIEQQYGQPYKAWIGNVSRTDIKAIQTLVWFLRRKAGRQMELIEVDFKLGEFDYDEIKTEVDTEDPEASAASEAATSSPSSTGTESNPGSGTGSPSLTSAA